MEKKMKRYRATGTQSGTMERVTAVRDTEEEAIRALSFGAYSVYQQSVVVYEIEEDKAQR